MKKKIVSIIMLLSLLIQGGMVSAAEKTPKVLVNGYEIVAQDQNATIINDFSLR